MQRLRRCRETTTLISHLHLGPSAVQAKVVLAFALGQVVLSSGCLLRVASALLLERHVPMSDVFGKPLQQLGRYFCLRSLCSPAC